MIRLSEYGKLLYKKQKSIPYILGKVKSYQMILLHRLILINPYYLENVELNSSPKLCSSVWNATYLIQS